METKTETKIETKAGAPSRPHFAKRVLITAGMPYGSKELHFGHIGGVFVHADVYARFMKDRIGEENVIFVSGTDCYGSPIMERYRLLTEEKKFSGTITDFVKFNHEKQAETLKKYLVAPSLFSASALGEGGKIHTEFSAKIFDALYASGSLKLLSTYQFFDEKLGVYLNGRQVEGRCPINGCKSEKAYADECGLGHQYFPEELIAPVSTLSGTKPSLREVKNWYFDTEAYFEFLTSLNKEWEHSGRVRRFITDNCAESLKRPTLYVKDEIIDTVKEKLKGIRIADTEIDASRKLAKLTFSKLSEREQAVKRLAEAEIRYRTGKTLVPFRLSGNIEWGVPVPTKDGANDLTFWVWPESLWAPISFTQAYLKSVGKDPADWRKFWCDKDAEVVQVIGEDNIYFYALAQNAMFHSIKSGPCEGICPATVLANKHILFFNAKASSSGTVKPPMADELLSHYSAEQLRAHFFAMGLNSASVPFQPKPFSPEKTTAGDPVFKEWGMFTNLLNRAVRTVFYSFQKYNNGNQTVDIGTPNPAVSEKCDTALLAYEGAMHRFDFPQVMQILEDFFRFFNADISAKMKDVQENFTEVKFEATISDGLHMLKASALMSHPIAPVSTEKLREYLDVPADLLFSWDHAFAPLSSITKKPHELKFLEPKVDFFSRPEWQY